MELLAGATTAAPAASARIKMEGAGGASEPAKILCQYPGCQADLTVLKRFNLRCKICEEHCKALSLPFNGVNQRFCQQCNKFHPVEEFDKDKRGCRAKLEKHNRRRRIHRKKMVSGGDSGAELDGGDDGKKRKRARKDGIDGKAAGEQPQHSPGTVPALPQGTVASAVTVNPAEGFATVEQYLSQLMQHQPPVPSSTASSAGSVPFAFASAAPTDAQIPAAAAAPNPFLGASGNQLQDYMKMAAYAFYMAGASTGTGAPNTSSAAPTFPSTNQ
mmetsp:Transcript_34008/g.96341  ORF Transcript_34008/g.96341 Transcript_34008/m.96341 type:complete len:273 (+) Transcript_34008:251-1069(+)